MPTRIKLPRNSDASTPNTSTSASATPRQLADHGTERSPPSACSQFTVFHPPPNRVGQENDDSFVNHIYGLGLDAGVTLYGAVRGIAEGKHIAARIHGALTRLECKAAYEKAVNHHARGYYTGAPHVGRIGDSLFETQFSEAGRKAYYDNALRNIAVSRALFGNHRNPMDLIRTLLDEASPMGAGLMRIAGQVCQWGLVRFIEEGAEIKPHTDVAGWDVPDSLETQQIEAQISVLVFLSQATKGGETTIYPVRMSKPQYDANRLPTPDEYAINHAVLPTQSVTIRAEVGDILLFEARYPHRVSRTVGGPRFTVSGFIGVLRDGRIVLFS